MRVVQISATWCGHCPPAALVAQAALDKNEYILAMHDTGNITFEGEKDDSILKGVEGMFKNDPPKYFPDFRIVDNDFNLIYKARGVMDALREFKSRKNEDRDSD